MARNSLGPSRTTTFQHCLRSRDGAREPFMLENLGVEM
jgi:hypothetical protein